MAAISKKDLEVLEAQHGLGEDGLTYQQRLSRITKVQKGEEWNIESNSRGVKQKRQEGPAAYGKDPRDLVKEHPLYGKKILITPMMVPDKNRALYFDEPIGPDIEVEEVSAGQAMYGAPEDVDRMAADYKVIRTNSNKIITAKTTLPKTGQEISYNIGENFMPVPVVRGNDGQRGYIWSMPTHMRQVGDTMIQMIGLKTLITMIHPELLGKFSGKPVMMYVDGLVLAASIPQTDAIVRTHQKGERRDAKLGLG